MRGTTTVAAASLSRSRHSKHWPVKSPTNLLCRVCFSGVQKRADNVPDMMWVCAWCLVSLNIAQSKFVIRGVFKV
jgi:hypothetical protein